MATNEEPRCERCGNSGWEEIVVVGVVRMRRCEECPFLEWKRGCGPGMPLEESTSTLENYDVTPDNQEAVKQAKHFLDGVHPGLYLHGGVGTGKTRLACSILNTLWKKGTAIRFKRVTELLLKLMPGADPDNVTWDQVVDVPVLCLDDVGANQGTDFARRMLQTIFDARLDRGHRTIWTSNLDLDDLATFLQDERLPSRITGNAKAVHLAGKDWRLRRPKKKKAGPKPKESSW